MSRWPAATSSSNASDVPLVGDHVGVVGHHVLELVRVHRVECVVHAEADAQQIDKLIEAENGRLGAGHQVPLTLPFSGN